MKDRNLQTSECMCIPAKTSTRCMYRKLFRVCDVSSNSSCAFWKSESVCMRQEQRKKLPDVSSGTPPSPVKHTLNIHEPQHFELKPPTGCVVYPFSLRANFYVNHRNNKCKMHWLCQFFPPYIFLV